MKSGVVISPIFSMNGGFMYLAAVIDWSTRAILSYKLSNSMDATLATDVLTMALAQCSAPKIFNQGVERRD